MVIPPLSASFEYCVKDNLFDENSSLGIGGYLAYSSSKTDDITFGSYTYS